MCILRFVLVILVIIECCILPSQATLYEGDFCSIGLDSGECVLLGNCPPALKMMLETRTHKFGRCGFKGLDEIVCCPSTFLRNPHENTTPTSIPTPKPLRKSKKACLEYANQVPSKLQYQIIAGNDTKLGEFPHMVAIGFEVGGSDNVKYICGGSLITLNYILSAAHCFIKPNRKPVQVRLGKVDIVYNTDHAIPQDFLIENITIHPKYSKLEKINDIALIKIKGTVKTDKNVHPACLYHKSDDPIGLVTTGWGVTTPDGETSPILQKATLIAVPLSECNQTYVSNNIINKQIVATQICASSDDATHKDSCLGDSGGPLQAQVHPGSNIYSIVGVTSYGKVCAGPYPGIYTRVHAFTDWIEEIVWP